jgi:hypothetical protein
MVPSDGQAFGLNMFLYPCPSLAGNAHSQRLKQMYSLLTLPSDSGTRLPPAAAGGSASMPGWSSHSAAEQIQDKHMPRCKRGRFEAGAHIRLYSVSFSVQQSHKHGETIS